MTEDTKKVLIDQNLRKEPRQSADSPTVPSAGALQVHAGEIVKVGANPPQDETLATGEKVTWVFVEATGGLFVGLRKGYVADTALVSTQTNVAQSGGFQAFLEQVDKESFV